VYLLNRKAAALITIAAVAGSSVPAAFAQTSTRPSRTSTRKSSTSKRAAARKDERTESAATKRREARRAHKKGTSTGRKTTTRP
jgi:hypothetical protein